jgi:hypothetical protein
VSSSAAALTWLSDAFLRYFWWRPAAIALFLRSIADENPEPMP